MGMYSLYKKYDAFIFSVSGVSITNNQLASCAKILKHDSVVPNQNQLAITGNGPNGMIVIILLELVIMKS